MKIKKYYLYHATAERALSAIDAGLDEVVISTDLNQTTGTFQIMDSSVVIDESNHLSIDDLHMIIKNSNKVYGLCGGNLDVIESREGGYYKLVPTSSAPYLEISGVKMHISKGVCPYQNARETAVQVVRSGHRVLDTCGGLGYTAIASVELGAKTVISVEVNPVVTSIRESNPWSQKISDQRITMIDEDVAEYIRGVDDNSFDSIIHDPPRFSLAGELYSEDFYRQMYRVLRKKGGLFHYTGNPGKMTKGKSFMNKAAERLKFAGFRRVTPNTKLMGLRALQ